MPFVKHGNKIHDLNTLNKQVAEWEEQFNYAIAFAMAKPVKPKSKKWKLKLPMIFDVEDLFDDDFINLIF